MNPTPFIEANVVLAAQENEITEVDRLLGELLPNERRSLYAACERVLDRLDIINTREDIQ